MFKKEKENKKVTVINYTQVQEKERPNETGSYNSEPFF